MDLHARVMNIPVDKPIIDFLENRDRRAVYRLGHRDARHEAAYLVLCHDKYIAALEDIVRSVMPDSMLQEIKEEVMNDCN